MLCLSTTGKGCHGIIAPPPPAVRAGGAGGLVLPGETAAHASETLANSGICVRNANNSIRKAPSKASSPLAHQFCVFLSSSSARCCPAVPEPLLGRPRQLATTCSLPAAVCCRSRPLVQLASPTNPRVRPHAAHHILTTPTLRGSLAHTSHSKKPLLSARIPPPDRQFKRQGRGLTESKGKRQCGSESLLKVKVKSGKGRWSLLNVQ